MLAHPKPTVVPAPPSAAFDFAPRTRVVFGRGAVAQLGSLAAQCGVRRVLLVTDRGLRQAGHVDRAQQSLAAAGLKTAVFDGVIENPTTTVVEQCVAAARHHEAELLVGFGGGSSLDTAKGCNFLVTNGGRMEDYWGTGKASRPMLPLIAVPTTAGTGSECQSYALISQEGSHIKMACGDPKAAPCVALLDPELTLTQPAAVAAATGIDCLAHAVESAVSRRRTAISEIFSREAFRRGVAALPRVMQAPGDIEARGEMLLAAALAGMAIENSMLGAAHSAANPLTARFGIAHGQAVGAMLPFVVRFNAADPPAASIYLRLARDAALITNGATAGEAATALAERLEHCLAVAGLAGSLAELGVSDGCFDELAAEAARQWTAQFNPREVTAEAFAALYREAYRTNGA